MSRILYASTVNFILNARGVYSNFEVREGRLLEGSVKKREAFISKL